MSASAKTKECPKMLLAATPLAIAGTGLGIVGLVLLILLVIVVLRVV